MTMVTISNEDIEPIIDEIREDILKSPWPEFLVKSKNSPYGLGIKGNRILEIFENMFAIAISIESILKDELQDYNSPEPDLSTIAAYHMAFSYGAREIDELTNYRVRTVNSFNISEIKNIMSSELPIPVILKDIFLFVTKQGAFDIESVMDGICGWLHLSVASLKKNSLDPRYRKGKKLLSEFKFKILNLNFELFSLPRIIETSSSVHLPIKLEQIIGNRDYIDKGKRLIRDLIGYDLTEKKNPKKFNQILFGLGRPGCGKTATANALGNYLMEMASKFGIEAKFVVIRRTDWASSYQNASSKALLDRFKSALDGFNGIVLFYWADIDTAFSSRGDKNLRSEEKGILGTAFGLFDGTILPMNGQWALICDANYMQMDEATISRLSQDPCVVKGPEKAEDYVDLLRNILLGSEYSSSLNISDEEWNIIGEKCLSLDLSGRDLSNLSRRLISEMENFEYPEEYFSHDFKGRKEIIKKSRTQINHDFIISELIKSEEFKTKADTMEKEEKIQNRVDEIELELVARKMITDDNNIS